MTSQRIQQEAICCQWFKQRLILNVSKASISQRSQIKEDTVEPSVPAREFNLKAYATITRHNDPARLGVEPKLADHHSQAARTAALLIAPPGQAVKFIKHNRNCYLIVTQATVIDREPERLIRWIKEAVHIRKEGQQAMNRDEGSYQLSHAYDRFLDTASSRCVKNRRN